MERSAPVWIWARRGKQERLWRVHSWDRKQKLCFPDGSRLRRSLLGWMFDSAEQGCCRSQVLQEGDVLIRSRVFKNPRAAQSLNFRRHLHVLPFLTISSVFLRIFLGGVLTVAASPKGSYPLRGSQEGATKAETPMVETSLKENTAGISRFPQSATAKRNLPFPEKNAAKQRAIPGRATAKNERRAREAFLRGRFDSALIHMESLRDRNGRYPISLRSLASEIHYARCRKAYLEERIPDAVANCENAVAISSHAGAEALLQVLAAKARQLFLEGYVEEEDHPAKAAQRYREVLRIAPSKEACRAKARKRLQDLVMFSID